MGIKWFWKYGTFYADRTMPGGVVGPLGTITRVGIYDTDSGPECGKTYHLKVEDYNQNNILWEGDVVIGSMSDWQTHQVIVSLDSTNGVWGSTTGEVITEFHVNHGDIHDDVTLLPTDGSHFDDGEDVDLSWSSSDTNLRVDVKVDGVVVADQVLAAAGSYTVTDPGADITVDVIGGAQKTLATHFIPRWEFAEDVFDEDGNPVRWVVGPETLIQVGAQSESESVAQGVTVRAALTRLTFTDGNGAPTPWKGDIAGTGIHNTSLDYHGQPDYVTAFIVDQVTDPDLYDGARAT